MPFPSDLTLITVTGTYLTITGAPVSGQVNFTLTAPVQDSVGKTIFNAFTQSVALNPSGSFSIVLPCTDNTDFNPVNFPYLVTEVIPGMGRAYYVSLPHTLGTTVDVSQLAPVSPPPVNTAFGTANTWTATQTFSGSPAVKITTGAVSGDVLTSDGSGNATWQPVPGLTNPMTTLGDMIDGGASGLPTRLAGPASGAAPYVLTSTPSGGVAQAPVWSPQYQPWQFPVSAYTAKGNCKVISDGTMASTGSGILTSASGPFTNADVGKSILVAGAGNAAGRTTLVTTIASYQSATQVTLTANPAATVANAWCVYGSDDTAAFNSAVSAAYAWWQANNWQQPEIIMPGIYMIAGAPTQGGATKGNAQIPLPVPPMTGQRFEPRFTGSPEAPSISYGLNSAPAITGGTLICARTDGTNSVTFGPASVIGSWTAQQGAGNGVMANLRPFFDGVSIILPYGSTYCGFDLYGCTGTTIRSAAVTGWATPAQAANPNAGDFIGKTWVFGLRTPVTSNDGQSYIARYAGYGLMAGIYLGEHVMASDLTAYFCYYGINAYSDGASTPMLHASHVSYACVEACNYQLAYQDANIKLDISCLDMDSGAGGSGFQIYDPGSVGRGEIRVRGLGATQNVPAVNGGNLLRIINADQVPGTAGISQPGVPGNGSAFRNNFWRDAVVTVTGGSVTAIAIADNGGGNSLTLGITSGSFVVASGKQITLTYSVTPSWTWTLL